VTSPNSKLAASVCAPASAFDLLQWQEQAQAHTALWRSESSLPKPRRIEVADDTMPADTAFRHISEGASLLWRGDFQNARQLLLALGRRLDKKSRRKSPAKSPAASGFPHAFHLYRQSQAQRARMLASILIELDVQWHCALRRAPDWSLACSEAWGAVPAEAHAQSVLVPLRDLLGWSAPMSGARRGWRFLPWMAPAFMRTTVFSRPCAASISIWWRVRAFPLPVFSRPGILVSARACSRHCCSSAA
jgi:hypothetical protein